MRTYLPAVLHYGISLPLIDEGVAAHFRPVRIPGNVNVSTLTGADAANIRAIAVGSGNTPVDRPLFERLPNLEIVARCGVGYDHIDAVEAAKRGIVVTNTPDVLTEDVADIALFLLLATVRRTSVAERFVRSGRWLKETFPLSFSIRERSIGILGLGRIGKAIASRVVALGAPVSYCGRSRQATCRTHIFPICMRWWRPPTRSSLPLPAPPRQTRQ